MSSNTQTVVSKTDAHKTPRWGGVVFAREPAALVLANIGWHLGTGASEMHLFLDRPDDPVAPAARDIAGCHVTCCDRAFWNKLGKRARPDKQTSCQQLIYDHVFQTMQLDWLVPLDADELLFQHRPLAEELAAQPGSVPAMRLHNLERVMIRGQIQNGIFDGVFRRPVSGADTAAHQPMGTASRFLKRGLAGYSNGKSILRRGAALKAAVHTPIRPEPERAKPLPFAQSSEILHFDGMTRTHWLAKMLRYAQSDPATLQGLLGAHRVAQARALSGSYRQPYRQARLHDRIKTVSPNRAAQLRAAGLLFAPALGIEKVIAAGLGGSCPELSAQAFDAAFQVS